MTAVIDVMARTVTFTAETGETFVILRDEVDECGRALDLARGMFGSAR